MDLRKFLAQSPDLSDMSLADGFASHWRSKRLNKGARLTHQEHPESDEFILLEGCLASSICDQDGKEVWALYSVDENFTTSLELISAGAPALAERARGHERRSS